MEALAKINVPGYLQMMVKNYFRDQILKYDTEEDPKTYVVTAGGTQGSVFGPLLWNYVRWPAKAQATERCAPVAFADDIAIVTVVKHRDELVHFFNITFKRYQKWLKEMGQKLVGDKTKITLITRKKAMETVMLRVGSNDRLSSQLQGAS